MKAKKPICGEKPPSRAVAICSGIAIAASVSPAMRSPGKSLARNERSERNTGQRLSRLSGAVCAIDGSLLAAADCRKILPQSWTKGQRRMEGVSVSLRARRDCLANGGERGAVVEIQRLAAGTQAEVAPECGEVGCHGLRPHLAVQARQRVHADRL